MGFAAALVAGTSGIAFEGASAHAADTPRRIHPDVPWALEAHGEADVDPFERLYGVPREALPEVEPFWQDGMLFTRDSHALSILDAQGLDPLPAMAYEAAPGILYVAMEGVTLEPRCLDNTAANAARNCSPLVEATTTFPPFGSSATRQQMFQQLRAYYEPFNVLLTVQRPPDWVPYTMAVIGGSAGLAGQPGGVCGVANVACDGLQRNHVSLTFPSSCGSGVAETAAQETSHNWGLEHTNTQRDLLYPFVTGGTKSFVDDCMVINHDTGSGVTQCGYIHEEYCPAGGGEQQNSYAELMGVFGPRVVDDVDPIITSIMPADGTVLGPNDKITVSATVSENSNFLAVRWSWLEGLPEGLDAYTKCTNNVCTDDFQPGVGFDVSGVEWTFVTLDRPPPGTYRFHFEVADAYGNYVDEIITIEARAEGASDDGGASTTGTPSGDDTDGSGTAALPGDAASSDGVDESESEGGRVNEDETGCACTSPAPRSASSMLMLLSLVMLGVRRTASIAKAR